MRLTDKVNGKYCYKNQAFIHTNMTNKLGQLEDIEDELGIELTKLNEIRKAKKGYAFSGGDIMVYRITEIDLIKGTVKGICDGCWNTEEIKDYGKTWALTKEELTNE